MTQPTEEQLAEDRKQKALDREAIRVYDSAQVVFSNLLTMDAVDGFDLAIGLRDSILGNIGRGRTDVERGKLTDEVESAFLHACDDNDLCPECGGKLEQVDTIVLGVHPYGSTTATEYGAVMGCPDCDWRREE